VGPRAGLDGPHRDPIRGPSSPQRVAISTELSRPKIHILYGSVLSETALFRLYSWNVVWSVNWVDTGQNENLFRISSARLRH
jgi:hypothetical protein